jgi:outer membrane protein OmpA-like peptidoglycan-associated protein
MSVQLSRRPRSGAMLAVILSSFLCAGLAFAQSAPVELDPLAQVAELLERAGKLGARRDLPGGYRGVEKRLEEARRAPLAAEDAASLLDDARRLANRAAFVNSLREARSPLEAIVSRFDLTVQEVAAIEDVTLDTGLSGDEASARLLELLTQAHYMRQVQTDSLRVQLASLQELTGGRVAAQDSLIIGLRLEISGLRRRLWETDLRAGVAEADRSAAESVLTRRQDEETAVKEIGAELGERDGTVVLTAAGEIVLQVYGLRFGVGSARLASGQSGLVDKLAAAVKRFPGAAVRVEGHTDDTGTRTTNVELSQKRASIVARALAQGLQIGVDAIPTVGHGPDRPIASNGNEAGRARNRRIDVVITPVR